jgi:hypothetical protein
VLACCSSALAAVREDEAAALGSASPIPLLGLIGGNTLAAILRQLKWTLSWRTVGSSPTSTCCRIYTCFAPALAHLNKPLLDERCPSGSREQLQTRDGVRHS